MVVTSMMRSDQRGFGLIEALIGLMLLSVGLLGIGGAFAQGMRALSGSNYDIVAREKAVEAVESVFSSRDTQTITWAEIRNEQGETGTDNGVFMDGPHPLRLPGADGLVNTRDDDSELESVEQQTESGTIRKPLNGFTRQIEITTVSQQLRQIKVTVRYAIGEEERKYVVTTYISSYS
jgi:type II secretory pathway component PulJ